VTVRCIKSAVLIKLGFGNSPRLAEDGNFKKAADGIVIWLDPYLNKLHWVQNGGDGYEEGELLQRRWHGDQQRNDAHQVASDLDDPDSADCQEYSHKLVWKGQE
jgi:hypothetical protein